MRRFYSNDFRFDDDDDDNDNDDGGADDVEDEEGDRGDGENGDDGGEGKGEGRVRERIVGCVVGSHLSSDLAPSSFSSSSSSKRRDEGGRPPPRFRREQRDGTASLLVPDPVTHPRMFYVMTLGTSRDFRRCGLGSMLVESVAGMIRGEREAEDDDDDDDDDGDGGEGGGGDGGTTVTAGGRRWGRGLTGALYLHVITYNVGAIRMYERLGFVRVKEIKGEGETYDAHSIRV
jgi:ribosomal protein S18 acetylase RimI-like enzyme